MEPEPANESMSEMEEALKPRSFFSRIGGVYASPRDAFGEIGRAPRVLVPMIILIIIGLLVGFYLVRNLDLESLIASRLESAMQQGSITQQQMDQQLAIMSKFAGVQLILGSMISSLLLALVIAGYAKLVSVFSGAESRFKPLLSVTLYVLIAISVIQSGLTILIMQLKGPGEVDLAHIGSVVASSLGAILTSIMGDNALPKFVIGLANAVDAFAIWKIVLLAIGYSVVSKRLKTGTAASWLVLGYAIYAVITAAVSSMFNMSGTL
jgi:hypothetical protein